VLDGWENYDDLKGTWEFIKGAFDMPVVKKDKNDYLYEDVKDKNEDKQGEIT